MRHLVFTISMCAGLLLGLWPALALFLLTASYVHLVREIREA